MFEKAWLHQHCFPEFTLVPMVFVLRRVSSSLRSKEWFARKRMHNIVAETFFVSEKENMFQLFQRHFDSATIVACARKRETLLRKHFLNICFYNLQQCFLVRGGILYKRETENITDGIKPFTPRVSGTQLFADEFMKY